MAIDPRIIKGASNPELLEALRSQVLGGEVLNRDDVKEILGVLSARTEDAPVVQAAPAAARAERQRQIEEFQKNAALQRREALRARVAPSALNEQQMAQRLGMPRYAGGLLESLNPAGAAPPNVTALAELQRVQLQAEHDLQIREQFGTGADLPFRTTAPEFANRVLGGAGAAVEAGVGGLGRGVANFLPGDLTLDPQEQALEDEHQRQIRELYGTGADLPFRTTLPKYLEAVGGAVAGGARSGDFPSFWSWGAKGLGALADRLSGGEPLTPEQIFQRSMSQREHDREIAMQFGTGDIEGGGFSDAEEAAHKARQLDILHKARERAAFIELGVDPIAPQSTLPPAPPLPTGAEATFGPEYGMRQPSPVPPLPTGAEATFGPEYEMMAANALINTPIEATELLSPELRQKVESLRESRLWPGAPGRYPANVQAGRQSLTDYAAGLSSLSLRTLGPEYTPPGFAGPIGDNPIFAPGGGVPPPPPMLSNRVFPGAQPAPVAQAFQPVPTGAEATFGPEYGWPVQPGPAPAPAPSPAAPARSLSRNEAMNTNRAIAQNNPELLSLATLGSINPLPPYGTFDPPKQAAAPQAVDFPGGRLPGRSVAEPFGPPPQTPIYPPNVPAITTYGGFDPYDPSQNLPDMPAPSAPDAALDLNYWW
jgi:hypothetical protein